MVESLAYMEATMVIAHVVRKLELGFQDGFTEERDLKWSDAFLGRLVKDVCVYVDERKI